MDYEDFGVLAYLRIGENLRRYDLVGTKGLSRVNEGCEYLSSLPAFAWQLSVNVIPERAGGRRGRTSHGRRQRVVES
jgi:hypothetical protein